MTSPSFLNDGHDADEARARIDSEFDHTSMKFKGGLPQRDLFVFEFANQIAKNLKPRGCLSTRQVKGWSISVQVYHSPASNFDQHFMLIPRDV